MNTHVDVEIPESLQDRPRDQHGNVVGWVIGYGPDGAAMQGTNQAGLVALAIAQRLCGQCGKPLGYWVAFIGDADACRQRIFVEPPMHPECAEYGMGVCPWLRAEEGFAIKRDRPGVANLMDRHRPARMGLYLTRSFTPIWPTRPPFIPAARAAAAKTIRWF